MKKTIAILLVICIALSFTACSFGAGTFDAGTNEPTAGSSGSKLGKKELVYDPQDISPFTFIIDQSSVYFQDPEVYFGGDLSYMERDSTDGYSVWDFKGDDTGPMDDFIKLLCSGDYNLKLVDESHKSYEASFTSSGGDFHAYLLNYTGTGMVRQTTDTPFIEDEVGNVAIYGKSDRAGGAIEFHIYIPNDMQIVDLGLRHNGGNVEVDISGTSAAAGLYRLADGSFETTDGRLHAALGKAMVLRDGEAYETTAELHIKESTEELWTGNFYRNEMFYFSYPTDAIIAGDMFSMEQIQNGAWWVDNKSVNEDMQSAKDFGKYNWPWCLGAGHNGNFFIPSKRHDEFKQILVKLLYDSDDTMVFYIYAGFTYAPEEVEALCVVDLTQSEDETTIKSSSYSSEKTCSACSGSGNCSTCGGSGLVRRLLAGTTEWVYQKCTSCRPAGSGNCPYCNGEGHS